MRQIILLANLLFFVTATLLMPVQAQPAATDVKTLIDSRQYSFVAQMVMPMDGASRQLTTPYDMTVYPDKIDTYLPYFGRAYIAPINPSDAAMDFVSTHFSYTPKTTRNGWQIIIRPKDNEDVRELILDVTTKGYATLSINSNNRQEISYRGYITEPQRKEHRTKGK